MTTLDQQLQGLATSQLSEHISSVILRVESPLLDDGIEVVAGTVLFDTEAPVVQPGDAFRLASVTKTFTAVAFLQLVERGLVSLDQHICSCVDQETAEILEILHLLGGASSGPTITLRQLLHHANGLFDYATAPQFFEALMADPGRKWRPQDLLRGAATWGTAVNLPGEGYPYHYSDTAYVLVGLAIEQLTGEKLHEVFRKQIFGPLEMADTSLEGYEANPGPTLTHAREGTADVMVIDGSADWAGGGLISTAKDLAKFGRGLFDGSLLGPEQLFEMEHYRFRELDPTRHSQGFVGYGLGLEARVHNGRLWRGHRGHWGVLFHVDPVTHAVITGTINQANTRPDALFVGAANLLEHALT